MNQGDFLCELGYSKFPDGPLLQCVEPNLSWSWSFRIMTFARNEKLTRLIRSISFRIWYRYDPRILRKHLNLTYMVQSPPFYPSPARKVAKRSVESRRSCEWPENNPALLARWPSKCLRCLFLLSTTNFMLRKISSLSHSTWNSSLFPPSIKIQHQIKNQEASWGDFKMKCTL